MFTCFVHFTYLAFVCMIAVFRDKVVNALLTLYPHQPSPVTSSKMYCMLFPLKEINRHL